MRTSLYTFGMLCTINVVHSVEYSQSAVASGSVLLLYTLCQMADFSKGILLLMVQKDKTYDSELIVAKVLAI